MAINLAGVPTEEANRSVERELRHAMIEIVDIDPGRSEVRATKGGRLGLWTFRRAWYYWTVSGPTPMDVALKLYTDPLGRDDVRTEGFAGNIDPAEYCAGQATVDSYHIDSVAGLRLFADAVRPLARAKMPIGHAADLARLRALGLEACDALIGAGNGLESRSDTAARRTWAKDAYATAERIRKDLTR